MHWPQLTTRSRLNDLSCNSVKCAFDVLMSSRYHRIHWASHSLLVCLNLPSPRWDPPQTKTTLCFRSILLQCFLPHTKASKNTSNIHPSHFHKLPLRIIHRIFSIHPGHQCHWWPFVLTGGIQCDEDVAMWVQTWTNVNATSENVAWDDSWNGGNQLLMLYQ